MEKDLIYYYGSDWPNIIRSSEATRLYAERIRDIGKYQPELLISHAYTRYMRDLSGNQILKNVDKSVMKLDGDIGTEFYVFHEIADENKFKIMYRNALDLIPLKDSQESLIISEANMDFNLNMEILQELNTSFVKIFLCFYQTQ